ncbi:hypothetical protein [Methylomonas sp. DH-1]|uniref:hypothetical protein n=1 Tax=Methylomonas sp. (strain DH-1) TaxID=1727196 RepID=UPI0007C8897C|nr:hypothetical protein [Methylomonas sp. DH-1]ANE56531.1 hypothetical protein AYM39_16010 [Methylomonas sp. DH-1]
MSNSNYSFSSRVGKEAKHVGAAATAAHAASLVTVGGTVFPLAPVMAPVAVASLPVVLGVGLATYGACKLLGRLFD